MTDSTGDRTSSVDITGQARAQLRVLPRHGIYGSNGRELIDAIGRAIAKLKIDPHGVGDPIYLMRKMRMVIHHLVERPLYFEYGVREMQPVVVVRWVALL